MLVTLNLSNYPEHLVKNIARYSRDPNDLEELAKDPREGVRRVVARNPFINKATQRRLSQDKSIYVRAFLCNNINADKEIVADIIKEICENPEYLKIKIKIGACNRVSLPIVILNNPFIIDGETIHTIVKAMVDAGVWENESNYVKKPVLHDHRTLPKTLELFDEKMKSYENDELKVLEDVDLLDEVARNTEASDVKRMNAIAYNPKTSGKTLDYLAHVSASTWRLVLVHENTLDETLNYILYFLVQEEFPVYLKELQQILKRDDSIKISNYESENAREEINVLLLLLAGNPNNRKETLDFLARNFDKKVQLIVSINPSTRKETVEAIKEKLLESKYYCYEFVRSGIQQNIKASKNLFNDEEYIRKEKFDRIDFCYWFRLFIGLKATSELMEKEKLDSVNARALSYEVERAIQIGDNTYQYNSREHFTQIMEKLRYTYYANVSTILPEYACFWSKEVYYPHSIQQAIVKKLPGRQLVEEIEEINEIVCLSEVEEFYHYKFIFDEWMNRKEGVTIK